jgi:transaldolase
MQLFLDTANLNDIREATQSGLISGVTTNPALAAKEGRNFTDLLKEILEVTGAGPVFAEAISLDVAGMVREGKELAALSDRMVVKIPAVWEGFQAVKQLGAAGVKTAVTMVYSPAQALMAAVAGADYVASFLGRANDVGIDGLDALTQIAEQYRAQNISTKILAASVRTAQDAWNAALAGADILTMSYSVLKAMAHHPQTVVTLDAFLADWKKIENI